MKSSRLSKLILAAAVALSVPLAAQSEGPSGAAVEKSTARGRERALENQFVDEENRAPDYSKLSPEAKAANSDKEIVGMRGALTRVVGLQGVARQQKDIIKLNCVNDKLLQIKKLMNIAEGARVSLTEASAQANAASGNHYATQIHITSTKVSTLRDEAEACVGEDMAFLGDTEVLVEGNEIPDDPSLDPSGDSLNQPNDRGEIEQPGYASPFL